MAQGRYDDDWHGRSDQPYRRMGDADQREGRMAGSRPRGYDDMPRHDRDEDRPPLRDQTRHGRRDWRGDEDDRDDRGRDDGHAYGFVHGSRQGRDRDEDQQQSWSRRDRRPQADAEEFGDFGQGPSRRYGSDPGQAARPGGDRYGSGPRQGFGDAPYSRSPLQGQGDMFGQAGGYGHAGSGQSGRQMGGVDAGHRGKGPKGYSRSDGRIREDCCDRLADSDMIDASNMTVTVSGGEVTLEGTVSSRQEKRAAEDCVEQCSGVTHVQNNLRVGTVSPAVLGKEDGSDAPQGQQPAGKSRAKDT